VALVLLAVASVAGAHADPGTARAPNVDGGAVTGQQANASANATNQSVRRTIRSCTTITKPGVYTLSKNLMNSVPPFISGSCIEVRSSDVVLDGAGHRVDGIGVSDTTGVVVAAKTTVRNVTVENLTLTDWNRGVYFRNVVGGTVRHVTSKHDSYGMSFENTTDVAVRNNTAEKGIVGIYVARPSHDNAFSNNSFEGNYLGGVVTSGTGSR